MNESNNRNNETKFVNQNVTRFIQTSRSNSDVLRLFEDPTYLGFRLFFLGINNDQYGGLLGGANNPNSARYYLNQIGDTARFTMLDNFVNLLQEINLNYPWYWSSISGLDEAWKRTEMDKTFYEKTLNISCLESVDLRITSLIDLYRKSAYDHINHREVLTDNLREFEMSVMLFDNRDFNKSVSNSDQEQINNTFFGDNPFEMTQVAFNMSHCQISLDSGASAFADINNAISESTSQELIINYNKVEESNLFKILGMLYQNSERFYYVKDYLNNILITLSGNNATIFRDDITADSNIVTSPSVQERATGEIFSESIDQGNVYEDDNTGNIQNPNIDLGRITDDFINDLQADVSAEIARTVQAGLNRLFLGNVYGVSARTFIENLRGNASGEISSRLGNALRNG